MSRALVLLSGEETSIPEAEARALFLTYDQTTTFEKPEKRVLIAETRADPEKVARRIAYARRVGPLIGEPMDAYETVKGRKVRLRVFKSGVKREPRFDVGAYLRGLDAEVDLKSPEYEFTLIEGPQSFLALTRPAAMAQRWSLRSPRKRAFFHPSAIFPKLSRALVNMARCREGEVFVDPFAGTGSLLIEASECSLRAVALDRSTEMAHGALANMKKLGQAWEGVVRADALASPLLRADGLATDVPYGRASSTMGRTASSLVDSLLNWAPTVLASERRMVVMHARELGVAGTSELEVEEEHYLYVHRKLTRAVTVLRRK